MYTPVQTNEMPASAKIKNMIWGMINATVFRITPTLFRNIQKIKALDT